MERSRANKKTGFKMKSPLPFSYGRSRGEEVPAGEEIESPKIQGAQI